VTSSFVPGPPERPRGALALAAAPRAEEATPLPPSAEREKVVALVPQRADPVGVDMAAWRTIVLSVRGERPALASVFEHAIPLEVSATRVRVGYAESDFLGSQAGTPEALAVLTTAVHAHYGAATEVHVLLNVKASKDATVYAIENAQRKAELAKARGAVEQHPVVREVVALFAADLRDIKLPGDEE
jgi:DNA polymerase-3 subunit gamma/tau